MSDEGRGWAEHPPGWAVPVSIPCNITLVARDDLFVRIGAACVFPDGLRLHLITCFDARTVSFDDVQFHGHERFTDSSPARLQARFPDGRVADSAARPWEGPMDTVFRYDGGGPTPGGIGGKPGRRHEGWWWVSPSPPSVSLEISAWLRGAAAPAGVGYLDLPQPFSSANSASRDETA